MIETSKLRLYLASALALIGVVVAATFIGGAPAVESTDSGTLEVPATSAVLATTATTTAAVTTTTTTRPTTTSTTTTTVSPEVALLSSFDLEEKAAQLLVVPLAGPGTDNIAAVLTDTGIGGVFITAGQGSISSLAQVVALNAELQRSSIERVGVGLLVATDQEGGQVFKATVERTTYVPSARVFGRVDDPKLTSEMSEVMGRELAALGVNVDLAPVADVKTTSNFLSRAGRTYGSDVELVARQVGAAVRGLQAGGVAATLKHYPGHGSTRTDSHFGLPVVDTDLLTLSERDLVPFAAGISAGAKLVMLGHLVVPALDPENNPATFSAPIIDLLRSSFDGVIITDDVGAMAAVSDIPEEQRVVRAIAAGVDLVLGPRDPVGAIEAIVAAVGDGTIPATRLDEAVLRVMRLKLDLGLLDPPIADLDAASKIVGGQTSSEARSLMVEACRNALGRAC